MHATLLISTAIVALVAVPSYAGTAMILVPSLVTPVIKTLGHGQFYEMGAVTPQLNYQASGGLTQGGCLRSAGITDCFALSLAGTGQVESTLKSVSKSKPTTHSSQDKTVAIGDTRQRIELYSSTFAQKGETWNHVWKSQLVKATTGNYFFHLMQILSRNSPVGGPVISLDAVADKLTVTDNYRNCTLTKCPSIALSSIFNRTLLHDITIQYGDNGSIDYTITDIGSSQKIMQYKVNSGFTGDNASVKFGMYRFIDDNTTSAASFVGDYSSTKLKK